MRLAFLHILIVFLMLEAAMACPFCTPSSTDLYTITSNSLAVVKAEKVADGKYKIVKVMKGKAKVGKVVLAGSGRTREVAAGSLVLLSTISNPAQPYWSEPARPLSEVEFSFLNKALNTKDRDKLLDLAARFLDHKSKLLSESAYSILGPASIEEVQQRAHFLGRAKLIELIQSPQQLQERKSLYIFMVMPSLKPADKAWVRPSLFNLSPYAKHFPAYMIAYAKVAGAEGINEMAAQFLKPDTTTSASFEPTSGFAYIGANAKNKKTREAARAVFRRELKHPARGVFAIAPLAEWRDFSVAAEVEKMADTNAQTPWVVSSAARYFQSFKNSEAKAALARMKKKYPEILDNKIKPFPKSKS